MMTNRIIFFAGLLTLAVSACQQNKLDPWIINTPAEKEFTNIKADGSAVIPNGRIVKPLGTSIQVAPHPYGLALSPDGNIAVTANSGTSPLSITIIKNILGKPDVQQVPPGPSTDRGVLASVFMGLAVAPDNETIYVSGGEENKIFLFSAADGHKIDSIDCAVKNDSLDYSDGYIGDMVLTKDGKTLYAVDQINFRMMIIDTKTRQLKKNVAVGRYPFGIVLSPDEKKVYVANVGMYQYYKIPGADINDLAHTTLPFPAFGFNTKASIEGIKTDTMTIPGLGDPNSIKAFSVFTIDVSNPDHPFVSAKTKTGNLVGQKVEGIPAVGGSSPNSLAATSQYVFVSNGNNDNISVIDAEKDTVVNTIYLKPDERIKSFRGIIPFGLAVSPDQKRLYVAESGINAIGVIDIPTMKLIGHIPAGWFPAKVKVSKDGKKLIVTNAKGFGSGPNGGKDFDPEPYGSYIGNLMHGTVSVMDVPDDETLEKLTREVLDNNFKFRKASSEDFKDRHNNPIPLYPGEKDSPIKHIVFISKENRTYDEIFGQLKNAEGDASLARYGEHNSFHNRAGTDSVHDATVMPNHLALARQFSLSDNFYVDSDVSADGHRWLVNTYPNEWVETCTPASYGGNRYFKENSNSPGIYAMNGAAGAVYPEDYNEAGSMWDHLERNQVPFYNFGFSVMFEPAIYDEHFKYTGIRHFVNYPVPQPIFNKTSRTFPTYNTAIPDQFRVDMFKKEFAEKWINGTDSMPSLVTVIIPNDHGAGDRPEAGYPFRESYMADNDLAIGRIVEFLSHTPYWKNMMIVITEDDAQNGVDHIDAHRSVLLVISPYVKRGSVSHKHYSFGSIFKTFWNVLDLPYLNQYDAAANDFADFFTDKPDFAPYNAVEVDKRIFDPQKALDPLDEKFDWKALEESPEIDNIHDMMEESKELDEDRLENRERH